MIRLNCFFKANEGTYDKALEAAIALVAASRKEAGCVAYDVFESATVPDVFVIVETWKDAAALTAHSASDHFKTYAGELEKLGAMKIEKFDFPGK